VLVHGSGSRDGTWADQRPLAEHYRLVIPYRRGYGGSVAADPDFESDAVDIAELLGDGAHLVGFSYGGVSSLLTAARRPDAVRSLTVIEPPAFAVAAGDQAVIEMVDRLRPVFEHASDMRPEEFDAAFDTALGFPHPPEELDAEAQRNADSRRRERPPWEAEIPLDALTDASRPTLVVSGGWSAALDAVCDVLVRELSAERLVFHGFGGHGVQHAAGFNAALTRYWNGLGNDGGRR
jgi:pimeloyl-ACP methyl ester carboxylesterase